jgi:hypothetical protein
VRIRVVKIIIIIILVVTIIMIWMVINELIVISSILINVIRLGNIIESGPSGRFLPPEGYGILGSRCCCCGNLLADSVARGIILPIQTSAEALVIIIGGGRI